MVAEYTDSQACPDFPEIDEVLTISAFPCSAPASRSIGRHSLVIKISARRLTPSCMSTYLVVSESIASPIPTPALLTRTSSRPNRSLCASTSDVRSSSLAMLAGTERTSNPAERRSSAAASSFSGRLAETVIS